jgi:hypothetical protein
MLGVLGRRLTVLIRYLWATRKYEVIHPKAAEEEVDPLLRADPELKEIFPNLIFRRS